MHLRPFFDSPLVNCEKRSGGRLFLSGRRRNYRLVTFAGKQKDRICGSSAVSFESEMTAYPMMLEDNSGKFAPQPSVKQRTGTTNWGHPAQQTSPDFCTHVHLSQLSGAHQNQVVSFLVTQLKFSVLKRSFRKANDQGTAKPQQYSKKTCMFTTYS